MSTIAEVPYKKEREYVQEKIRGGKTIARSNPHVQTLQRAARQGVKEIQSFNDSVDLETHLH